MSSEAVSTSPGQRAMGPSEPQSAVGAATAKQEPVGPSEPQSAKALWTGAKDAAAKLKALQTELPNFLSTVPLFAPLCASETAALARSFELVRFKDCQSIITQGDVGVSLFVLVTGRANVHVDGVPTECSYGPTVCLLPSFWPPTPSICEGNPCMLVVPSAS